jgi:adenylate kinase
VKRRLVLLGPPGSGKGTQAEMITRHFGIPVTSPGAILRRERDLGTPLGQETAEVLRSGGLVSDKIIIELIEDWLRLHGGHGFVFDGFPRTLPQAESLMSMLTKLRTALDLAIWLEVSEETVRDRITGRLQCGECGFTTSSSSAQFANRPVCPYCDGRLERRNDDDLACCKHVCKSSARRPNRWRAFIKSCRFCIVSTATAIAMRSSPTSRD